MVEPIDESLFIVVQRGHANLFDNDLQSWTHRIYDIPDIPMVHVRPFQHDAQSLFCIEQINYKKLQTKLKERNWRFMKPVQSNIMYACPYSNINNKGLEYMLRTKAYIQTEHLYTTTNADYNNRKVRQLLDMMVRKIQLLLKKLLDCQAITSFQYKQMDIQRVRTRLDFLFFIPDVASQQEHISIEPIMISALSPLMPMSCYLNRLLEPIYYNQIARTTTIYKGADIVSKLETYEQQGYLQSNTLFVAMHIKDPYTSITHEQLIKTCQCFLHDFSTEEHIQGMKIPAILELIKLTLENQYFLYNNSIIYQQIKGGSTGLVIITLLINIFLFYWQQSLLVYQGEHEVFGRCFNDIFFTWNQSEHRLHQLLNTMKINYPFIQWDINIQSKNIHYLDAQLNHLNNNQLHTQVYHDWRFEPYVLPFIYDASSVTSLNIIRMALIRAVLCCSQIQDFEEEQQYIEVSFLFNRFPSDYIRQHTESFFRDFQALDVPMYHDQDSYNKLRRQIRQFDQEKLIEKIQNREAAQTQCIWYIHSTLSGTKLVNARRNPAQFLPPSFNYNSALDGVKIELVGTPNYPPNTI